MKRIMGTLREGLSTFMVISRSILFRIIIVSGEGCSECQNTCFVFSNCVFFETRTIYETVCKNMVETDLPQFRI